MTAPKPPECCGKPMIFRPFDRSYYCPRCQRAVPPPSLLRPVKL